MKLWFVCFVMLFGSFELYQWICRVSWFSDAQLSLPVALAGGILLSIASNSGCMSGLFVNTLSDRTAQSDRPSARQPMPPQTAAEPNEQSKRPISFQILTQPKRSISFEIQKPNNRESGL